MKKKLHRITFWNSMTGNVTITGVDPSEVVERANKHKQACRDAGVKVGDPITAPN